MALGEMRWALDSQDFRTLGETVAGDIGGLGLPAPQSSDFYVALGALILDQNLVTRLIANGQWAPMGFSSVEPADRDALAEILDPNRNADAPNHIYQFCYTIWAPDCFDRAVEWDGHVHPVAN
jgi:hypothetical protein